MEYTITLSSEVYGNEQFDYSSKREMLAGLKRLEKSCRKAFEQDGIERQLIVEIGN